MDLMNTTSNLGLVSREQIFCNNIIIIINSTVEPQLSGFIRTSVNSPDTVSYTHLTLPTKA